MKKPTRQVVFDEVLVVLKEIQDWFQFPEEDKLEPAGRQFYEEWKTLKGNIIKRYLDKLK